MASFISRTHAEIRKLCYARRDAEMLPDEVPRGLHKEYQRMPRIVLPVPTPLSMPLGEAFARRESFHEPKTSRAFSAQELGDLLGNALGMRGGFKRKYPSGGSLYPIETYLVGNVMEGYPHDVFHYHPKEHALEHLWKMPENLTVPDVVRGATPAHAQILLVFTAVWRRTSMKYGDWAYYPSLFEAGHMGENILLAITALGGQARPIGGFNDAELASLLDLDEDEEQSVHSILLVPSRGHL